MQIGTARQKNLTSPKSFVWTKNITGILKNSFQFLKLILCFFQDVPRFLNQNPVLYRTQRGEQCQAGDLEITLRAWFEDLLLEQWGKQSHLLAYNATCVTT